MMRFLVLSGGIFALCLFFLNSLPAQNTKADTTIYEVAEVLPYPLFSPCRQEEHEGWTPDSVRRCAESYLMQLLAQNIRYPESARSQSIQGTVVAGFIVEQNGRMNQLRILKDIGAGCGEEALRVLQALDSIGLRWKPAMNAGQAVRMRSVIPIRFRLEEAPPYLVAPSGDTVHTVLEQSPEFAGGPDSLATFVINTLNYPAKHRTSCRAGVIEMALLIRKDGSVSVENTLDYNKLGLDYEFEAIRFANRSAGLWTPARYDGAPVNATYPLRVLFKSPDPGCATANDNFDKAMLLTDEGAALAEQEQYDAAIATWSKALELQPDNTEILYYRGSAYFSADRRDAGCQDFNRVKALLGTTWFESLRRLLCGN
jgi:TonB family protein